MRLTLAVLVLTAATALAFAQAPDVVVLGDFEQGPWDGLVQSKEYVKAGEFAGKWANPKGHSSLSVPGIPADCSAYDRLVFWLHSGKANGQILTFTLTSEDDTKDGWDYYYYHLHVDWDGWKRVNLSLSDDFRVSRSPRGWNQIESFRISAGGWGHHPKADTVLHFDDMKLARDPVKLRVVGKSAERGDDGGLRVTYDIELVNVSEQARKYVLTGEASTGTKGAGGIYRLAEMPPQTPLIKPGGKATVILALTASAVALAKAEPLQREEFLIKVKLDDPDVPDPEITIAAAVPLPEREHPLLFSDAQTFANARARAEKYPWAKERLDIIIRNADKALEAELVVPDEAGQWSHYYVCKKCGAGLKYANGKHICKGCGAEYTGWPWDQVIVGRQHGRNLRSIESLGLGYALTGNEAYAGKARAILLAYARKYPDWPYHDRNKNPSHSGARLFSQTLDESVTIIRVAWGYDLIYNSPCLSDADRELIENRFLREAVVTIKRHDAGISNWQSWHNAGIAAVGFCLQDADIASLAINGKSGLRFQLQNSILSDGFWYEGTAAYHYYALDALRYTTEAAHFAGIDFYNDAAHKSLYDAPLLYTFPDLRFPAVNDSNVFSLVGRHRLYELAYARFGDPNYLGVVHPGGRNSLEAFLWGVDELPQAPELALASRDFSGLGAVVLRQGSGDDQLYVHLDYGPHGGGHGHLDKLAMILFGLGRQLAPDPARLAYAAPMQGSWYKQTFAHNTVCVDAKSQRSAEGRLIVFHSQPGLAVAQADCDTAYDGVTMRRTMALTPEYLIDIFSVSSEKEHTWDWLYHNFGELKPMVVNELCAEPPGDNYGYQHMKDITRAQTNETWSANFGIHDANVRLTMLGAPDTRLYFGMGMANNPPEDCPMIIARRTGTSATFISVIEPYRATPAITGFKQIPVTGAGEAVALQIDREGSCDSLMVADKAGTAREFAGITSKSRVTWVRKAGDEQPQVVHID